MELVESVFDLPVQSPPDSDFSSADLKWTKFGTTEHHDDVALIPYARVDEFIIGECSNVECPTRFHIERGRKRSKGSLKEYKDDEYLEYRMYWCSFGPENYGEGGSILPSRRYRLNTRNRAARPQSMRGCTCHFIVKRLYARPSLALLIYNERRHVNKSGFLCHGPLDRDAIGPGAKKVPYVGSEIQQQTMSMIYLGIPEENVLQKHIEGIQRYCGSDPTANNLASKYVQKLEMIIKRSTHELDLDDQTSVKMWVERNRKSVFFCQESSEADPFILGIQTEWQLQQMVRFGNRSLMAIDSTFGIKRLKVLFGSWKVKWEEWDAENIWKFILKDYYNVLNYPLCTLLVFDSRQHALPVAWVITRSFAKPDISKWMKALVDRVRAVDTGWKVSGFVVDDAATDVDPIRDTFCCPVLFSLWRLRRSWLRNVVKLCDHIEVQREVFRRLGKLIYSVWGEAEFAAILQDFMRDFADQSVFMQYFRDNWLPKIDMWLSMVRTLPIASLEASGAIEAYHVKLKCKIYDDTHLGAFQRVDWLLHKLITELHSSYWLDRYSDETDSFQNVKDEYIFSTSWQRALRIPDSSVCFEGEDYLSAKVQSQKNNGVTRTVWNPASEFAFCDCSWSLQGNLCKHVVKVNMLRDEQVDCQTSMSYTSFGKLLLDLAEKPVDDSIQLDVAMAWTHQMLDQVEKLVELSNASDIGVVVKNLPLKWVSKKSRTSHGKPLRIENGGKQNIVVAKRRKRKRLSTIR